MNEEELLKEIMKLPKVETNNPISAMIGINVDDLMNAVDRLNKVPDFNNLLKENQELKKQLEELDKKLFLIKNELHMREKSIDNKLNQQKEFIKWLEDIIDTYKYSNLDDYKNVLQKYKEIIGDDK